MGEVVGNRSTERSEAGGIAAEAAPRDMWVLDLDERELPWRAHLIVRSEPSHLGEVRYASCGQWFTVTTQPRGWMSLHVGHLPMPEADIHCGLPEDSCEGAL
jgi:hypothetical protein